jgi:hypothetical protein
VEPKIIRKQRKFASRSTRLAVSTSQGYPFNKVAIYLLPGRTVDAWWSKARPHGIGFTGDHQLTQVCAVESFVSCSVLLIHLAGKRGILCEDKGSLRRLEKKEARIPSQKYGFYWSNSLRLPASRRQRKPSPTDISSFRRSNAERL